MLKLNKWSGTFAEIMARRATLTAGEAYDLDHVLRPITQWRENPDVAAKVLTGIFMPPGQRWMLRIAHRGRPESDFIGSRGTSKTAVIDVVYAALKGILYAKRKAVLLQAVGFRGGQLIFNDLEKLIHGEWYDQEGGLLFLLRSTKGDKPIKKMQNFWEVQWTSGSDYITVPTNDAEKLRGMRAHDLNLDERNFMDPLLVEKVAESFMNVLGDWKTGGEAAADNVLNSTTTVDYGWRDYAQIQQASYNNIARDRAIMKAAHEGKWELYADLVQRGFLKSSWFMWDYSDNFVREFVTTRAGQRYQIAHPDPARKYRFDPQGLPFTHRDEEKGEILKEPEPEALISTYPSKRDHETKMLSGIASESIWLAEQRNVIDSSAGDVYSHMLIDRVASRFGNYVVGWEDARPLWQQKHKNDKDVHYSPTIRWTCADPCVLGVDYAPGNRDFCAFVVIRLGFLAQGEFNPLTDLGWSDWANVVWCEQHRTSSAQDVADKVFSLAERYNLVYHLDPYETDPWKACRAIGLDVRNGGTSVRDELIHINTKDLKGDQYRIYDPMDTDERVKAFATDPIAKPMLDTIAPTGPLNERLVDFTVTQMTQGKLYLPKYLEASERPSDARLDIGFESSRVLEHQLRSLQQEPTGAGYRKFFMKGNAEDPKNKKDLWAAFIYGAKQARAHLLRHRLTTDAPPPMGAVMTQRSIGSGRFRAPGTRF